MVNAERRDAVERALRKNKLDVIICALPANALMLSGYSPVVGSGVAVATCEGRISLLIPEDEAELAQTGWADDVRTFNPGSLENIRTPSEAIRAPLKALVNASAARIGFESGEVSQPVSYAALHLYGAGMAEMLAECFPEAQSVAADDVFASLRARKTPIEIDRIRRACRIAAGAFTEGASAIRTGVAEVEVADAFRRHLNVAAADSPEVQRADGFVWCMSGANAALAASAYARSRTKKIHQGDLVLIHCNSYADGYWTDITRTFCAGEPDDRQRSLFEAVTHARNSALAAIRPGASAASVDSAARKVLRDRGLGDAFKHSTGHGAGFEAISPTALPRLHPLSPDVLEPGMVFNVEPAVYFNGYGGIRHCDMVAMTTDGYELLTPFQGAKTERARGA